MNSKERKIPHRSHSEAIHRRRILAETRQARVLDVHQRIKDGVEANHRLAEIEQILFTDDSSMSVMNGIEREQTWASLMIERMWLHHRLGKSTQAENQSALTTFLNRLEETNPQVYRWLTVKDHELSIAEKIRNKVVPSVRIGRYFTKR